MSKPTPSIAVSASNFAAIGDILLDGMSYFTEDEDVDYFIGESSESQTNSATTESQATAPTTNNNRDAEGGFVTTIQIGLEKAANEKQLQDAVFLALSSHPHIDILPQSKKKSHTEKKESDDEKRKRKAREKKFRTFIGDAKEYVRENAPFFQSATDPILDALMEVAERDTKVLLDLYAKTFLSGELFPDKMKDVEAGLLRKISSRPDIVALLAESLKIFFGEIKNADIYDDEDAVKQECCYLMLLLYWWRVVCARRVDKVYGFTLCGPRCRSNKTKKRAWYNLIGREEKLYHISLIELAAPKSLGDLCTAKIWAQRYKVSDRTGLTKLYQFFNNKGLWKPVSAEDKVLSSCAAWITLPMGFPADEKPSGKCWELVKGGTCAVVIKCTGTVGVFQFLESGFLTELLSRLARHWRPYLLKVKECGEPDDKVFYIKVKTRGTEPTMPQDPNADWECCNVYKEEIPVCKDFLNTYPVSPIRTGHSYAILMNDRGTRIDDTGCLSKTSLADFAKKLWKLWEDTAVLNKCLEKCHGDVADFNIVMDTTDFVLIDWDEASRLPKARLGVNGDLNSELKHLEPLRDKPDAYTDVQFALTYLRIKKSKYETEEAWDIYTDESLTNLRNAIPSNDKPKILIEARNWVKAIKEDIQYVAGLQHESE